jgi:hypothetical protein
MRPIIFLSFVMIFCGCSHDREEMVEPTAVCDTITVTYTLTVLPIVQTRCALPECHVAGGNGTGDFTTYAGLRTQADNGHLVPAVQRTPGAIPMPPDGSMIPECDIRAIVAWVNAGALEN